MGLLQVNSISGKLLRIHLALTVVAVFVLFVILELDFYHSEHDRLVESLGRLVNVQSSAIETAVWEFDLQRVQKLLFEQSQLPFFQSAQVFGKNGELLATMGDSAQPPRSADFRLKRELLHHSESDFMVIGHMVVTVHDEGIRTALLQHLKINGLILLILLVTLGAGTIIGVRVVIGRPLDVFRQAIERPMEEQIRQPLQWSRQDELGKVLNAYNTMLEARHQAELAIYQREEELTRVARASQQASAEADRFNRLATGRELRMLELKKQVNDLSLELGRPLVFDVQESVALDAVAGAEPSPDPLELFSLDAILELVDLQTLLDAFCSVVGVAAAIIDLDGKVLVSARWQRVCTDFHRVNPVTCARCIESDQVLSHQLQAGKEYIMYRCSNGLTDAASPIVINNQHVANVIVGQFHLVSPDPVFFQNQAESVGFDAADYMRAMAEVPVVSEEKLPFILGFLTRFANMIATLSMERLQARRSSAALYQGRLAALNLAEETQKAREELAAYQQDLERQVKKRAAELREAEAHSRLILDCVDEGIFGVDCDGRVHFINPSALNMVGREPDEVIGQLMHPLVHHSHPDGTPCSVEGTPMWRAYMHKEICQVESAFFWHKDGHSFPVEYSARPIERDGVVVGAVVTFRDIAKRREAEALVQEKMAELEKFIQVAVGRELRMIALKEEINQLCSELGRERPYKIVE